jgi:hypothetical protein
MSEPASPSPHPALRASDADRERVVEVLRVAAGDGRLDVDELDERMTAVYATRTLAGLETLTRDLVTTPGGSPATSGGGGGPVVRPGAGGDRRIVSIMSGSDRKGRWRVGARCLVLSLMGGAELDFCDAELSATETTVRVVSVMGGDLRFPSGADVRVSRFGFMGGNDVRLDLDPPPSGAPVIRVRLFALMGGNQVRQGRRPARRRELRDGS